MQKYKTDKKLFLPKIVDNTFRGLPVARYTFYGIAALTVARSLLYILLPEGEMESYRLAASGTIVYMFGVWGLSRLLMGSFYCIVALRYKSLIPLMYAFIAVEYAARIILGLAYPVIPAGTAPGEIGNYILLPLAAIMILLSITYRERRSTESRMR